MTPKDIKDFIIEVLNEGEIGTYTYSNGATTLAIATGSVPNNVEVTGLEFVIPNFPKVPNNLRASDLTHRQERWHLEIMSHDPEDKGIFFTAIDKLLRSYAPNAQVTPIPEANPKSTLQRARFTIIHSDGYDNINYA